MGALADADCEQVMAELQTRAPRDVEDTLRIQRSEVAKCRKEAERVAKRERAKGNTDARGGDTALPEGSKH